MVFKIYVGSDRVFSFRVNGDVYINMNFKNKRALEKGSLLNLINRPLNAKN